MSSGESTNVPWRTPSGESTFEQNNHSSISLILIHGMVIYLLCCAIQHLNNWSQCCLATLHVPVSKKQTTTQRMQATQKQGFKDKLMFRLLAIHPFVAAINYIVGEGNIIVSKFFVTNLSRSKCIVHTMCH